jgi:hypothetical protein
MPIAELIEQWLRRKLTTMLMATLADVVMSLIRELQQLQCHQVII